MSWSLLGKRCRGCGILTHRLVGAPTGTSVGADTMVCRPCAARLNYEAEAGAVATAATEQAKKRAEQNPFLLGGAHIGNWTEVQEALAGGADINAKENDGATALMLAAQYGHLEVVRLLLLRGAEVNAQDRKGATALMLASQKNQLRIVRALLLKGADVNAKNNDGATAMTLAKDDSVKSLLKYPNNLTPEKIEKLADHLLTAARDGVPRPWRSDMSFAGGVELTINYPPTWNLVHRDDRTSLLPSGARPLSADPRGERYSPEFQNMNVKGVGRFTSAEELRKSMVLALNGQYHSMSVRESKTIILNRVLTICIFLNFGGHNVCI
jgi:hypothetical protein